ncbi:MAG: hypothetical protein H3C55_11040 [Pseudorhodoplanes sp.]|nr:hypothetical protein [Pseudorhodoplanes sp.]MBW7949871.1 hypothetical protein [Pseudorhodoplanes sp.]MCQ3943357.1 hypothetical protein [Alphaproteobacteria bacterium]GIK80841.1 MAG: hypothetical protein BroJett024_19460 [Alphaproteobacteria bacterium]
MLGSIVYRLLGWFGGDLFATMLEKVLDHFRRKANDDLARLQTTVAADTQIAIAHANAELQARKVQAQVMRADRGWWVTAWIRPLIVYPCVVHFGAIVLDSTFLFGWGIARLPAPYDFYEQAIILSFFIARPFEKAARVFTAGRG